VIELPAFQRSPRTTPVLASIPPGSGKGREAAEETRRLWARATWFGIATYFAWSPITTVNRLLPAGSTTRGLVLTVVPLIGVAALLRVARSERLVHVDPLAVLLGLLIVWEAISVEVNAGVSSLLHVVPGVAVLLLAMSARRVERGMSLADIRFALTGVLPPLCLILVIGWIAQIARLVPLAGASASTIRLSIDGYRLQGLNTQPNNLGFLAALVTLIAFAAQPCAVAWLTRGVAALTLVATDSRTSFIALGVGLLLLWVLGPGRSGSSRIVALLGLMATGIGAWGLINVQRQGNTDVLSGRDVIWNDLLPFLHHVPLFGYGPNLFPQLVPLVFGPYAVPGQILDPQNQWLNDALEFGFVGAALLTLCVLSMPFHASRTYRWAVTLPLLAMVVVEGFSEVPLALFSSIDGAFPLFLLVMLAPRPAAVPRLLKPPPFVRQGIWPQDR
jgi:O-Antigen ligase